MKRLFLSLLPVMIILSIMLSSCSLIPTPMIPVTGPESSAIPTPIVVTSSPPLSDDVWDRITANNKMVVGTSWDYPPFASVNPNFKVVGYDIALIQEIGSRLNIPIEIQNFTFEGLQSALQINQIDLAVAAISISPERSSQLDFSPVYYINHTAILVLADSPITGIGSNDQLADFRVGVQRGTTYEIWLQQSLIDTGMMPASQMYSYMTAEEAIRDMEEYRVDLVVTGRATANYYNSQRGLRVVGTLSDQQNLAVAMRLATPRLKTEIDRVMNDMLIDGTILSLIQQYIQEDVSGVLPTPIPTDQPIPTALPPVPTAVPPACMDGMKFIGDVSYGDNNMNNPSLFKPGEGFIKTWRLQNTGNCTWTPNYHLVYAYGNVEEARMNGQQTSIPGNINPGETVDVSITLVAPMTPFTYQGFWQMENSKGERFGQTVWVGITTKSNQTVKATTTRTYCEVTLVRPNRSLKTNENFDAVWTVKNTSGKNWDVASVDYRYASGTEMHEKNAYDFKQTIKNGESGDIIVDMIAPDKAGSYSSQWVIAAGTSILCNLAVTVTVK